MQRNIINRIFSWNKQQIRKPLILMGARQVGKTWLMNEFAHQVYSGNTVFVNLMKMKTLRNSLEQSDLSPKAILERIEIALDVEIIPGKTLLVIDEIQESANTLSGLKFFHEDLPELAVIAAGSMLGLAVGRSKDENPTDDNPNESRGSFPVGKVCFLDIPPMNFSEFVTATGKHRLSDLLNTGLPDKLDPYAPVLIDLLKRYLIVGGMPEAINVYIATNDFQSVRETQESILTAYKADFVKHAPASLLPKIRLLWDSVPAQLAKENRKFIYSAMKNGARAREYETAIQWLNDAGMLRQVFRVGTPRLPLKSYRDFSAFKLYTHDVGLLGAMSELDPSVVLEGDALFSNFKGALTEQYALQEILAAGSSPCYWSNDAGNAEVEFVIQGNHGVYPVEVKAGINIQAKSLKVYRDRFNPPFAIRTSLASYHDGENIQDIPLYAFGPSLPHLLGYT